MMTNAHDAILAKVQKLLRLARSSNEHEAANAAARAAELMLEHQLGTVTLDDDALAGKAPPIEACGTAVGDKSKDRIPWKMNLARGVTKANGCKFYLQGGSGTIVFYGPQSALSTVTYVYKYLVNEVDRLAEEGWEDVRDSAWETVRAWKGAFRLGASERIFARLRDARAEAFDRFAEAERAKGAASRTSRALVLIKTQEEEVVRYGADVLRLGKARPMAPIRIRSTGGYEAGVAAGNQVNLAGGGRALGGRKPQLHS